MRVLVTGARGLVGGPLVRKLSPGHEVTALDLPEFDVRDAALCTDALRRVRPEAVVHLAAWTDVDGAERDPAGAASVNADGTRNVALACRAAGAAMLHVSTDYVFDGTKTTPYREDDATSPVSVYGRTKLDAERHVREVAPPRWWIVRCQSIYGAGKKSFVDAVIARARSGAPMSVVADQRVSPSWCEDVADALASVLTKAAPGVYHVSNSGSCTWYECARAALDASGMAGVPIKAITAAELARPAPRPANSVFDISKYEKATGAKLRPWLDAMRTYLASRTHEEASK